MHSLEAIALCYQTEGPVRSPCSTCAAGDKTKPHDIVMRCACRNWTCGISPHIWTATPNGDGTVALSPSVNWPGHFHEFYNRVPVQSMAALHFLEDAPA